MLTAESANIRSEKRPYSIFQGGGLLSLIKKMGVLVVLVLWCSSSKGSQLELLRHL